MRKGRARLVETLWDLITDDREYRRSTKLLVEEYADRIMEDIKQGIITADVNWQEKYPEFAAWLFRVDDENPYEEEP